MVPPEGRFIESGKLIWPGETKKSADGVPLTKTRVSASVVGSGNWVALSAPR